MRTVQLPDGRWSWFGEQMSDRDDVCLYESEAVPRTRVWKKPQPQNAAAGVTTLPGRRLCKYELRQQ